MFIFSTKKLSLFLRYLIGYADQFRHFENGQYVKRMFRVKGKRNLRIEQVCKIKETGLSKWHFLKLNEKTILLHATNK